MAHNNTKETVEQYLQAIRDRDIEKMTSFLRDDFVEEYPQSGERIKGKENWRKMYENFRGLPELHAYNLHVRDGLAVVEVLLEYSDEDTYLGNWIIETSDGKLTRTRAYFSAPFEAPQWRSEWVEMMGESIEQEGESFKGSKA